MLLDEVRRSCAEITATAGSVRIDHDRLERVQPGPPAGLDPKAHYLEGSREDVVSYLLTLDSINFGSGWFPTLRKRAGRSGYFTIAWALANRFREHGPWSNADLRALDGPAVAALLGQAPDHELMRLYARALRELGAFLGERSAAELVDGCGGSAERLIAALGTGMPFFADRGFYKRAQITANDLALAGAAAFDDLDRLTIFADNVVPHVLRVDGVLAYAPELAARVDAGEELAAGSEMETELRACAVHACELLAARWGVAPRVLDNWLWNRGRHAPYSDGTPHRTRTVFY